MMCDLKLNGQALNFLAFGAFSPLSMRSAPNDFPLAGHPYFGPNILFHTLHEVPENTITTQVEINSSFRDVRIIVYSALSTYLKLIILCGKCNRPI